MTGAGPSGWAMIAAAITCTVDGSMASGPPATGLEIAQRGCAHSEPRPLGSEIPAQKYRVLLMIATIAPTMISDVMAVRALWESLNVQPGPVASVVSCGSP